LADETYVFGSYQLVPAQRLLLNSGKSLRLGSRALEILITLVECAGKTVSKDQLIGRVWRDTPTRRVSRAGRLPLRAGRFGGGAGTSCGGHACPAAEQAIAATGLGLPRRGPPARPRAPGVHP